MSTFSTRLRLVMLLGGVSLVVGGIAALAVGALALASGQQDVELTRSQGTEVTIPAGSALFGSSVMVYTTSRSEDSPARLGCELVEGDGDVASTTRISGFAYALGDPVTVDGTTWYPLAEVETRSAEATLRCPGETLASAAVSQESTFGSMSTFIGVVALAAGVGALLLGGLGLLVAWWAGRR